MEGRREEFVDAHTNEGAMVCCDPTCEAPAERSR